MLDRIHERLWHFHSQRRVGRHHGCQFGHISGFLVFEPLFEFVQRTLPIRLSPTPTICSVSPWTAGKGRRRRIEEAIRLILDCSENRTGV